MADFHGRTVRMGRTVRTRRTVIRTGRTVCMGRTVIRTVFPGFPGFPGFPVVETHGRASLRESQQSKQSVQSKQPQQSQFYCKPKSLSSFIAGYKSVVTTQINNWIDNHEKAHGRASLPGVINDYAFQKYNRKNKLWQPNYHDHIIRNNDEYWPIKNYIKNNPNNWSDDTFHKT